MIVLTAPSGAGKTTIVRHLLKDRPQLAFSISACTRARRSNEVDGRDYYFLTKEEFMRQVERGGFVEWEEVYNGTLYGTLKSEVERLWSEGHTIIFDIDVKGALSLKRLYGDKVLTIFIKPPAYDVLAERLKSRSTESEEQLQARLSKAKKELEYESSFDIVILNDDLDTAVADTERVVDNFVNN